MGLIVEFNEWRDDNNVEQPAAWYVDAPSQYSDDCPTSMVSPPFGRRADAEIAARVLLTKTGIDFDAQPEEFDRQWNDFGGRRAIYKLIGEHLQW